MIIGKGSEIGTFGEAQVMSLCEEAFSEKDIEGKKILCIIPDSIRSGPFDIMFRIVYKLLSERVKALDFLVALGTHPPMSKEAIYRHIGISENDHRQFFPKARFFNHDARNPDLLKHIVTLSEDEIGTISGGLLKKTVDVTINKMVFAQRSFHTRNFLEIRAMFCYRKILQRGWLGWFSGRLLTG